MTIPRIHIYDDWLQACQDAETKAWNLLHKLLFLITARKEGDGLPMMQGQLLMGLHDHMAVITDVHFPLRLVFEIKY